MTAILAVFLAILLPAVAQLRQNARDVICSSRLRALSLACESYKSQHGAYPLAVQPLAAPPTPGPLSTLLAPLLPVLEPQEIDLGLMNQLAQFVGFKRMGSAIPAIELPPELQSPDVESSDEPRGPFALSAGVRVYYTGYVYTTALGRAPAAAAPGLLPPIVLPLPLPIPTLPGLKLPILLKPGRAAGGTTASTSAVLWADDVHVVDPQSGGQHWRFAHPARGYQPGPLPLSYRNARDCRGQHQMYTNGACEWVPGRSLGLQDSAPPTLLNIEASFRTDKKFWWF